VARKIKEELYKHDQQDGTVMHQAMVLTRQKTAADEIVEVFNQTPQPDYPNYPSATHHGESDPNNFINFKKGNVRILVVCGMLLEGFDRAQVSVVAVLRNVQPESRVLFSQFVGMLKSLIM
jgi:superfamily II DNA or RNA helicase